jgi:hypothetical protein
VAFLFVNYSAIPAGHAIKEAIAVLVSEKRRDAETIVFTSASADRMTRNASTSACLRSLNELLPVITCGFEQLVPASSI